MNPLSNISSVKADIQTAVSNTVASISRAWGHAVKAVTPDQTNSTQAKTNTSFQSVKEQRDAAPKTAITLQKAAPKPLPKRPIANQNNSASSPKPLPKRPAASQSSVPTTKPLPDIPTENQSSVASAKPLPSPPSLASLEKEINSHRMELAFVNPSEIYEAKPQQASSPTKGEIRSVSEQHVDDIPEKVEKEILSILQNIESDDIPKTSDNPPSVAPKETTLPQNSNKTELEILKNLISSLAGKNKLKLNENAELEIKKRSILTNRDEIGTSKKSQEAVNNLVNRLIKLSNQDSIPEKELLSLSTSLKESEWGKEAVKTKSTDKNFTLLERFLNVKISLKELTEEHAKAEKEYFSGYSSEIEKKYDDLEEQLKYKTSDHINLQKGINNLIKELNI